MNTLEALEVESLLQAKKDFVVKTNPPLEESAVATNPVSTSTAEPQQPISVTS